MSRQTIKAQKPPIAQKHSIPFIRLTEGDGSLDQVPSLESPSAQSDPDIANTFAAAETAERNGKADLPDFEEEEQFPGCEEPLGEDEKGEPLGCDLAFTESDEKDLVTLEARVKQSTRDTFVALRDIRQRKLFKLIKDDEGKPKYKSFDEYVEERHGHSRQWVTHGNNWLRIIESLDALGVNDPPPLTVDAAQALCHARLPEAGGLLVVLKEAHDEGVPLTKDNLKEIVLRRADYSRLSKETEGVDKPAAQSYAEYKQDCLVVKKLGGGGDFDVIADAQKLDGDLAENIFTLCTIRKTLPRADKLLVLFTGEALALIVTRLGALANEQAEIEKRNYFSAIRQQLKKKKGGLKKRGGLRPKKYKATKPDKEKEVGTHLAVDWSPPQPVAKVPPKTLRVVFQVEAILCDPGVDFDNFEEQVHHGDLLITGWPEELVVSRAGFEEVIGKVTEIDWQLVEVEEQNERDDLETEVGSTGDV